MLNTEKLIRAFMRENGYTNFTTDLGIRKSYLGGSSKTYVTPEMMLIEFHKWLLTRGKRK